MRQTVLRVLAIAVVLSPTAAFTQGGKAKPTTATYITKEEVDIVNKTGQGIDRNIKVVDIGHENFTVGIIHRGVNAGRSFRKPACPNTKAEPRSVLVPELVTASVTVASASPNSAENWLVSTCTSRMLSSP